MSAIDQKQAAIFVAVFFVIALLINSTQGFGRSRSGVSAPVSISPAEQQANANAAQAAQAAQVAAQAAAAQRAQYLARYLNGSFPRSGGGRSAALAVVNENGKFNFAIATALTQRLKDPSVQIISTFFTPEFVADGLFNDALAGSRELFRKLDLAQSVNTLILAREDVQYAQNAALENVLTATIQLAVTVVPVSGQSDSMTWTFTANGPGFSKEVARKVAEDRLIKQIAADTKMSLN